jgi:hypothetical protein
MAALNPAPVRPANQQFRPCRHDDDQGGFPEIGAQTRQQLQRIVVREVAVVDDVERGMLARILFEEPAQHCARQFRLLLGPHGQRLHKRTSRRRQAEKRTKKASNLRHPTIAEHALQFLAEHCPGRLLVHVVGDADAGAQEVPNNSARRDVRVAPQSGHEHRAKALPLAHVLEPLG